MIGCHYDDDDDGGGAFFAADINLDGFADIVIGAPLHDGGGTDRGAVFIFFGGTAGPSTAPDITIFGAEDGGNFGFSVAVVGDVNGDGAPDILVGAPFNDGDGNTTDEGTDRGRAFLYFGGPGMDTVADVTMTGAEPDARLGFSVARAGDVNLGGLDDWLVGAPFDDGDGNGTDEFTDRGRAFLYFGGTTPDGAADVTFTGGEPDSHFGWSVGSAGDINFGGALDMAVGAPHEDLGGTDRGRVYIFFGGTTIDSVVDILLDGDEDFADFGTSVAPVFDVNNDGIDDLLVGAPLHNAGGGVGDDMGRAYVFFGGGTVGPAPDLTISGADLGGHLGEFVSRLGDATGDGQNDFIVGAPDENAAGGRAYIFAGGTGVDATADFTLVGTEAGARFGANVAGFGDIDGSGRDAIVGAPLADAGGTDRGSVFIFSGGTSLDATADYTVSGSQDLAEFGTGIGN